MPIRMEKDPNGSENRKNQPRPGGSGGGGLARILPFLLMFLFKKPKLLIPVLLIGGVLYLFGFFDGCAGELSSSEAPNGAPAQFSFGATLDQEEFDKAQVFERLSDSYGAPALPASVSLERFAPRSLHQGQQGSCVGWASSYAARTILHARETGTSPDKMPFSPSFLYNQIALDGCQGAYMREAMETMKQVGLLPFRQFRYDERTCRDLPDAREKAEAGKYRIKGYNRLTLGATQYGPDILAIKQNLAQGAPVVIGMMVGGTFMQQMVGQKLWLPTQRDYSQYGFSGHAMCVIGYDDQLRGGAFQIMNSWGQDWGDNGQCWVRYDDFSRFVKEAYGIFPMGESPQFDENLLEVTFGLVNNASQQLIPLQQAGGNVFETIAPLNVGQKFKLAITNSVECNIYVFGEETDGSSYVLFPYTEKHSPYCGIVGTRLFPKDYSMTPDALGTRDRIAVVVTKDPIDYARLNARINAGKASTYLGRVNQALRDEAIPSVQFNSREGAIAVRAERKGKNAVAALIEIDKK